MEHTLNQSGLTPEEQNESIMNALKIALQETKDSFIGIVSPDTPVNLERAKTAARRFRERTGANVTYEQLVRVVLQEASAGEE
jgi:hypothetical protein